MRRKEFVVETDRRKRRARVQAVEPTAQDPKRRPTLTHNPFAKLGDMTDGRANPDVPERG